ncbi:hypothetical protein HID58_054217 [Brassica napus]|uniref:BnaC03g42750D protein n=5 Tax=Brassica TaxID=3705 RepID=A0A078GGK7_BRANA|nr:PREDICTED: 40S ribosomal protein S10, mitochondrial-like [Brassica oleracea var. oleracea]XP_013662077.1 40S ribosomal protein S10, mitochondrial [Brassica napus]KAG2294252.1 hypothetical protein Bca52824_040921 [Brassica carinata]VDC94171.1 unnamed protein product [Brassica oleracea]KAH0891788.1 hypothetical protein HID58_054217 [Brassica napus]CAF1705397.1 unnamed protein product [Brassica napus]CDY24302.1 BnaC03g42750D [Brassica napus]
MITGVLRRSSLPSRHSLSAALTSFDSGLSHHFSSAATVSSVSVDRNLVGNGSTLSSNLISRFASPSSPKSWMVSPARIAFQGYATEPESNLRDSKRKKESTSKIKGTRICIAIRSFENPEKEAWCLPPHTRYAAMPDTRTLYTVLRSPHVDKKSREQFEMRFKKRFLVVKAQSHELSKKLFWLKRYRILGAQYELQFHCKTRLDMSPVLGNINGSHHLSMRQG